MKIKSVHRDGAKVAMEIMDPDFMDQCNRVVVIVGRGNHVLVIYVDTVDLLQKNLRVLRDLAVQKGCFCFHWPGV